MKRRFVNAALALSFVVVAVTGGAAHAEPKALPVLPRDGAHFIGSFACEGTFRAGQLHKARFHGELVLGGKWLELGEEDVEPATGYLAKYLIGYDPDANAMVELDANTFGSAVYRSERGWEGSVLTMTSPLSTDAKASYVANRFRYATSEKDGFTVEWQIRVARSSEWKTADHLSCRRVA